MKTRLLLLLILFTGTALFGQNLVINPSFENTSSNCGNFGGEGFGTDLLDWDNANSNAPGDSCSSPDLFSACNTIPIIGGPSPTNMPNSFLGFQRSRTGTRHAGIITYAPGIAAGCSAVGNDNYREYIQGHTTTPLVAGQTYCVSMYVSLGDNVVWATNNIGVRFTNTQYLRDACANGNNSLINLPPQLNYSCTTPITDTSNANWVRIQWDYVAVGGERWFTIGNFYNNNNTTVGCANSGASINPYAYYYIDDVSITPNTCCAASIAPVTPKCPTDAAFNLTAVAPLGVNCNPTVTGTWSGPGITNANLGTFNPATAGVGTHTITYTLACGQTATTTIIVNNCAALVLCMEPNGNITVTGGTGPYQWQTQSTQQDCSGCPFGQCFPPICTGTTVTVWTNFANGATATPPGTFPFRVLDNAGNSNVISTLTGIPSCQCVLSLSTNSTAATCGGSNGTASVSVTQGTGPYTYVWSNGGTGQSITNVPGGTYTVTVTGGGCSSTTTVNVNTTPAVTATPSSTPTTCGNANGGASVVAAGGNGTYTYLWSNNASGPSISNVAAGQYTVTITSNGCTTTQTILVAASSPVTLNSLQQNTNCGLANGTATVNVTAGTGPFTYAWSNGG
ncbi:MAG: SprB repeat-containing protein [Sphingobacteriales bacterium JAD_PAG50586_3]|nr:MAG: SprB repeat-containing protein [Sphingobacteriales bacterium JAD_PAG50586_3]